MGTIMAEDGPVLLIGGGAVAPGDLRSVDNLCALRVAADGGADTALAQGLTPDWLVGDFDSASEAAIAAVPPARRLHVAEQQTTDSEKAVTRIRAPAILCLGFTGRRLDHELAAYNVLVRRPGIRAVVIGAHDICFHVRSISLDLPAGTRLSLFPMAPVTGRSEGLEWPVAGIAFAPDGRVGTSNRVTGPVRLSFDADGMLVILPKAALPATLRAWGLAAG